MRTVAKVDANQPEVVKVFRQLGWSVLIISQLKNCADIIVSKNGCTTICEIKDGTLPPSKQKLTEGEENFRKNWQGNYALITCVDDVLELNKKR